MSLWRKEERRERDAIYFPPLLAKGIFRSCLPKFPSMLKYSCEILFDVVFFSFAIRIECTGQRGEKVNVSQILHTIHSVPSLQ